jgi:hypothetical protein
MDFKEIKFEDKHWSYLVQFSGGMFSALKCTLGSHLEREIPWLADYYLLKKACAARRSQEVASEVSLKMLRVGNINCDLSHLWQRKGKENCDEIYSHYKINREKINLPTETKLLSSTLRNSEHSDPEGSIGDRWKLINTSLIINHILSNSPVQSRELKKEIKKVYV